MLVKWDISRLPGFEWNQTENAADDVIHAHVVEACLGKISRLDNTRSWPPAIKCVQTILFNPASQQNTSKLAHVTCCISNYNSFLNNDKYKWQLQMAQSNTSL